jgi:hypothetical protein
LASVLGWHNVDSVKNDKDIGIKKKNVKVNYNIIICL